MELRILRNFIAVVEEEGVSAAADALRISQPALSRQIKDLEDEVGATLFVRGNRSRSLVLTEKGRVRLHDDYGQNIIERLDNGLADFGVLVQPTDMSRYDFLPLPTGDPMGLLMRYDHPLATRESIHPKDLADVPVIVPQGVLNRRDLSGWYKSGNKELNIVGTMNLLYNASCFVQEGYGCAICLQGLVDTSWESGLVFQPLDPPMQTHLAIAWKKSQPPTPAADAFLTELRSVIADINRDNKESVPSPRNGAQR